MKNKFVKILLVILLFLSLSFLSLKQIDNIKADSGWDSSYDSGGSWDSGSDWSSSSWDNDYDYDYGSSSSGSHSSCTTKECKIENLMIGFFVLMFSFGLPILIIISISLTNKNRRKKYQEQENKIREIFNGISKEKVESIIPNFNIEEFNFKAYQIFYDIQMAWMNFDYDKLKELLTDELYNSYVMELDALKIKNHKNTMKDFELIKCNIFDLKEENGIFVAQVALDVKFYDYVENANTGIILRGTPNRKLNNIYILTLIKTKEETTLKNRCPQCGALVEGNTTGICEYCKSKLVNKNYDWVMSKKEKIRQR